MAATCMLDEIGCELPLSLNFVRTIFTYCFDVPIVRINLVGSNVKMLIDYARRPKSSSGIWDNGERRLGQMRGMRLIKSG